MPSTKVLDETSTEESTTLAEETTGPMNTHQSNSGIEDRRPWGVYAMFLVLGVAFSLPFGWTGIAIGTGASVVVATGVVLFGRSKEHRLA